MGKIQTPHALLPYSAFTGIRLGDQSLCASLHMLVNISVKFNQLPLLTRRGRAELAYDVHRLCLELITPVKFNWWVSFAPEFQCYYFCESSCLFYLSLNSDFYVSKIMHL